MVIWNELEDTAPPREPRPRLRRGEDAAPLRRRDLHHLRALRQLQGEHVLRRLEGGREAVRAEADELPGPHAPLRLGSSAPTATCRSATPSRRRSIATSSPARSTACCASGTSPRTTPTSSARREQIEDEIFGCLDFAHYLYDLFGLEARFELSTRPEKRTGTDEEWDFTEGALRSALDRRGIDYTVNEGDGAFYGPKIDLHMTDVARPLLADGHDPARRDHAAGVRPHLHGARQPRAHAVRHPPGAARLARALHRHPDRALRRRVPVLARAGAGPDPAGRRGPSRAPPPRSASSCGRPATGSTSASRPRRSASGSGRAELEKIPFTIVFGDRESEASLAIRERGGGQSEESLARFPRKACYA